ncbi:MAG: WYL domain-containing protein [Cellulosilyticum sp.]|nr:WYL domain-containing protein [Cellulosilyticum sp.]
MVLKSNHWYFQGYCHLRNDFRLFRLSRIVNLHIEKDIFTPRFFEKPLLDMNDVVTQMQKTIVLRIHKSIMDRVLDYCSYENFSPDDNLHYIVNFPFIENDYYYDMLLSFGSRCECLSPLSIRNEIKHRISDLMALYP